MDVITVWVISFSAAAFILFIKQGIQLLCLEEDIKKLKNNDIAISKAVVCGSCKKLILPGQPYGESFNMGFKYVHYSEECSVVGSYIGAWE